MTGPMKVPVAATRRAFLGGSLATAAALAVDRPAFAGATRSLPLYAVIHDERFAAARAFATEARRHGIAAKPVRGEVHDLWRDDLDPHWRGQRRGQGRLQPLGLAGMTTHDAVFLLAMMGRDAGMRVVFRAHHMLGSQGATATHRMFGPEALLARYQRLSDPEALWGREAAQIVTSWPVRPDAFAQERSTVDHAGMHAIGRDALVTWLMVPTVRAA